MELKIDASKLTPETREVLVRFAYVATRFHSGQFHKQVNHTIGDEQFEQTRVIPRSVETDYFDARHALLQCTDPELRELIGQLDVAKMLDSLEGQSARAHTDAHRNMVGLEKQLIDFINKNVK
jgi:hypothetical protein